MDAENANDEDPIALVFSGRGLMFSEAGKGLSLSGPEATNYRACLSVLYAAILEPQLITKTGVEALFRRAILSALTIEGKAVTLSEADLSRAIGELEAALTAPPQRFGVYYPVVGLAHDGLPSEVGPYRFLRFGNSEFDHLTRTRSDDADQETERHRETVHTLISKDIMGAIVAYREVKALEADAAKEAMRRDLQTTVDVINFYSDLIPYNDAHLSLPGDRDGAVVKVPIRHLDTDSQFSMPSTVVGRLGELSLDGLRAADASHQLGFSRLDKLLKAKRSKMQDIFLASVRWAGRATASNRNEDAFLLFVVALESLILSDNQPQELSYRLRLRVAHLLGADSESRQKIADHLSELYGIRSKIVHRGYYEVSDADLRLVRQVVKSTIVRLSRNDEFWSMDTPKAFGAWLEAKILE